MHASDVDEQVNTTIRRVTERMPVCTGVKWELQRTPYESEIDIVSDGRVIATVEAGEGKEKVVQMMAAAPDMLEALELVVGHKGFDIEYIHYRCRLAIRKARGELITP